MIDAKTIEELRGLLAKATPGPWKNRLVDDTTIVASNGFEIGTTWPGGSVYNGFVDPAEQHEINAALIVAMRNAIPALLDAASRAREDALREAAALLDLTNGDILLAAGPSRPASELLTARAVLAWRRSAILALINKPKGGDVNAAVESRYGDATSPGVTAGASAGWQSIETAPKDGTRILLGCFATEFRERLGHTAVDYWHSLIAGDNFDGWGRFNAAFWPPTHWMPLPTTPVNGGKSE